MCPQGQPSGPARPAGNTPASYWKLKNVFKSGSSPKFESGDRKTDLIHRYLTSGRTAGLTYAENFQAFNFWAARLTFNLISRHFLRVNARAESRKTACTRLPEKYRPDIILEGSARSNVRLRPFTVCSFEGRTRYLLFGASQKLPQQQTPDKAMSMIVKPPINQKIDDLAAWYVSIQIFITTQ